jgi:hypothetical protein
MALGAALATPALAHEISFGVGALSLTMFSTITFTDTTHPGPTPSFVWETTGTDIAGEAYIGYAYNINKGFDIAAEFFYDFSGPKIDQYVDTQSYIINNSSSTYGIRVLPGFNITPSARLFVDVGYTFMQTTVDVTHLSNASDFVNTTTTATTNKRHGAINYGAGMEMMFYKSVGLRASYTVTPASSNSATKTSHDGTLSYQAKPSFYAFYLGGIFRFGF